MSALAPVTRATCQPGSRLDSLLAVYAELKPQVDELAERLKTVSDAIKNELVAAVPGEQRIDVAHESLTQPLRLSFVERWELDTKRLRAEDPEAYVRFARKAGRWELRKVTAQ